MPIPILDNFCGESFWDESVSWTTNNPILSRCFRQIVLSIIPCIAFIILAPFETWFNIKPKGHPSVIWTWIGQTRFIASLGLALLSLIDLLGQELDVRSSCENSFIPSRHILSPIIQLITFTAIGIVLLLNRRNGIATSGSVWIFSLFFTFFSAVNLYHVFADRHPSSGSESTVAILTFPLMICLLLTSSFADCPDEDPSDDSSQENDDKKEKRLFSEERSPRVYASFPSIITYWWVTPLTVLGFKKSLKSEDLYALRDDERCRSVAPRFFANWKRQGEKGTPGVVRMMMSCLGWDLFVGNFLILLSDAALVMAPLLLKWLLQFIKDTTEPTWHGFIIVFLMFFTSSLQSIFAVNGFGRELIASLKMRAGVTSVIYRKALRLKNSVRKERTVGEIVNLMSTDAERVRELLVWSDLFWSSPLQIGIAIYYIYRELGVATFAGVAVMVLMMPINGFILNIVKKLQTKQMKLKDERVKNMSEILNGIKVIKLYAWEESFMNLILGVRKKEVRTLVNLSYLNAVSTFLWTCAPFFVAVVSFAVFVLIDDNNVLDAEKAFVSLTCFNMLRIPLIIVPALLNYTIFMIVSVKRLNKYLNAPELDNYVVRSKTGPALSINDASFSWGIKLQDKDEEETKDENANNKKKEKKKKKKCKKEDAESEPPITLENINAMVEKGSFTAIVGNVGSGKSSLMNAVLGEMEKMKGSITIGSGIESIAYVPQQAWIQNVSLKNNILFGCTYDKKSYEQIIDVCELKPDLEILPGGDETEIGEKGINLSGGQKQRVNLARACYSNSDLYLMDDPLSAVDAHVAKNLFDKVLSSKTGILRKKTRILVTNNLSILPFVDQILVMKNGTISETGSYKTLMENNGDFAEYQRTFSKRTESETRKDMEDDDSLDDHVQRTRSMRNQSITEERVGEETSNPTAKDKKKLGDNKLIEDESVETGRVKFTVYLRYLKSINTIWLILVVVGSVGNYASTAGANYWLSQWSADKPLDVNGTLVQDEAQRTKRLGVYAFLGLMQGMCSQNIISFNDKLTIKSSLGFSVLGGTAALAKGTVQACVRLHRDMLYRILRSPMTFFDTTPIGRVVNRFARDVDVVDSWIPFGMRNLINQLLQVSTTMIMIAIVTPYFLVVLIPISVLYYFVQRFYIPTSRQVRRLESTTRSPIYSHFSETLSGVSTIRGYSASDRFMLESNSRVDRYLTSFNSGIGADRWLAVRLEFCGNLIVMFAAFFAVVSRESIDAGLIGLSLSYAMNVTNNLTWLVRATSEIETNVVSIERILEYTGNEVEAEWKQDKVKITRSWPEKGMIEFKGYGARYRQGLDLVIRDINVLIQPQEKIGVVGRTGAGKSTITLSLFRIIEAAAGNIIIDGVNVSEIGLHELRKKLTIIPQDPVLFSGTIRFNLDPFSEKTDDELWTCLEHAHLKDFVKGLPNELDSKVSEGGENLSVGQRQLICLARALLRKTKILILDEATAAVDLETDSLIQSTIRSEFSDCTIITIAHRLHTILDSTRVLVLDQGKVVEFDSPDNLLNDQSSVFYSLARNAGIKAP